ncbi:MAG: CoA-binding protein [Cyanobacteria bacterium SBLK]|nr:CoA-binding protein [Cyanobacteria bacterium SBLK]
MNLKGNDRALQDILANAKTIAVVGHSNKRDRPSYRIARFLREKSYRVYPVNPTMTEIEGMPCYSSLKEIPEAIDIVNIFRRSEFLPEIATEAIAIEAKVFWAQEGIIHPEAAQIAAEAGLKVVMDVCIMIESQRLLK